MLALGRGYVGLSFFFLNDPATTEIYTLSLHDALPICHLAGLELGEVELGGRALGRGTLGGAPGLDEGHRRERSEEHTSELQSRLHLVCRLLLEKKKKKIKSIITDA